jgi:preprotein translocase subunit SecY
VNDVSFSDFTEQQRLSKKKCTYLRELCVVNFMEIVKTLVISVIMSFILYLRQNHSDMCHYLINPVAICIIISFILYFRQNRRDICVAYYKMNAA